MQIKIEKIIYPGKSLSRSGKVIFTDEGLPGENVEIDIIKEKSNLIEGTTKTILTPSPARIKNKCSHYRICSPYQYIDYPEQAKIKQSQILEIFSKITPNIAPFEPSLKPWEYRNKANFPIYRKDDNISLAYNQLHDPIALQPIEKCFLVDKQIMDLAINSIDLIEKNKLTEIKEITVRKTTANQPLLIMHADKNIPENKFKAIYSFCNKYKSSLGIESNGRITNLHGTMELIETFDDISLMLGPLSFFQINIPMLNKLISELKTSISLSSNMTIADLYCGVGTFGIILSRMAGKVILVESAIQNTEYLEKNIHRNNITNSQSYFGQTSKWLAKLKNEKLDMIILDPPRTGIGREECLQLLRIKPKTIIYLACDPMTMRRDIEILSSKYTVQSLKGYDFFPQTPHIEISAILQLR